MTILCQLIGSLVSWEFVEYFGTVTVICACWGEYVADFGKRVSKCESAKDRIAKLSTIILIIGLAIELVGVLGVAIEGANAIESLKTARIQLEKQVAELKATNLVLQTKLAEIDPHNLPIESISVKQVRVEILGEDSDDLSESRSELTIGHFDGSQTNMARMFLPGAVSARITQGAHGRNREYRLDFDTSLFQAFHFKPITPTEVNAVSVSVPTKFGQPARIVDGSITFIMNGTIKMTFPIPPQTNRFPVATSLRTNSTFIPIPLGAGRRF